METKELEQTILQSTVKRSRELILHNDDVNTFDHVIDCLISICDHKPEQAEQCAYIVHYKGKCSVKQGSMEKLEPMLIALQLQQLSAQIK